MKWKWGLHIAFLLKMRREPRVSSFGPRKLSIYPQGINSSFSDRFFIANNFPVKKCPWNEALDFSFFLIIIFWPASHSNLFCYEVYVSCFLKWKWAFFITNNLGAGYYTLSYCKWTVIYLFIWKMFILWWWCRRQYKDQLMPTPPLWKKKQKQKQKQHKKLK